jgi:hypothetical protein
MAKGIKSLSFSFVPFPSEVWDDVVPLSLSEFRFLGYLCKQIRFGEALRPISDDEMMHGIFEDGDRKDRGCGLASRNGVKQAREALVERGWITAQNVSQDPSRPRWMYELVLAKEKRSHGVTAGQLVSQRDTGTERQEVSPDDSTVSQDDTGGVTARQLVSPADTCNKEVRNTKTIDEEPEGAGDAEHLPPLALTRKVIEECCLADNPGMVHAVASAIDFLVKVESKSKNAAVEFLIALAKDEIERGGAPNKFWFDDRKWRVATNGAGTSRTEQLRTDNRKAIVRAAMGPGLR